MQYSCLYHPSGDLLLDSWRGASSWADNHDNRHHFILKSEYQEMGGDYLKEHTTSNVFVPYRWYDYYQYHHQTIKTVQRNQYFGLLSEFIQNMYLISKAFTY